MLGRAVLAVLVGLLVTAAPAAAASQKVRSYRVSEVRDLLDRTEGDRGGRRDRGGRPRRGGGDRQPPRRAPAAPRGLHRVERMASCPQPRRRGARAAAFPPADSAVPRLRRDGRRDRPAVASAYPAIVSASASAPRYQGRTIWALKVSDNVGTDEAEPEVLFTANQHAREHLTVEMALYILTRAHVEATAATRGSRTSSTAARSGSSRWSTRTASSTTSPPAPTGCGARTASRTARLAAVGTDLNRNWGYQWGCCGGSSGTFSAPRPTAARRRSRRPRPQRVRDFVNSRVVGGVQQIKARDRLPHLLRADPVAVRLHDAPTPRPDSPPTTRRRSRDARPADGGHQRLHARAGVRPLHRRRHDRRLAVGRPQDLQLHVRDVPATVEPGLLPARRGDRGRRPRATARRCCCSSRTPTACTT